MAAYLPLSIGNRSIWRQKNDVFLAPPSAQRDFHRTMQCVELQQAEVCGTDPIAKKIFVAGA